MVTVANIVGARPQFIKYWPVSQAIEGHNETSSNVIKDILIHTGQHYDYLMSKVFFEEFGLRDPDYHLGVGSSSHGRQTGEIMARMEEALQTEKPDLVLVYGDTNSTLGGSLAAAKLHIPVAHVEAGLRSFNKYMPEEINRVLTDHISSILFCPSQVAVNNLRREGLTRALHDGQLMILNPSATGVNRQLPDVSPDNPLVVNIGDIMYDVLLCAQALATHPPQIMKELKLNPKSYYLMTLHRAENTESLERLAEIIEFVNAISKGQSVIFPMHPRTRKVLDHSGLRFADNVVMIEPLGYFDMIFLLKHSSILLTDSGGLQKEAYWLQVPCITLRDETEWLETVESGWNVLFRDYHGQHHPSSSGETAYGDGQAATRIVNLISAMR